MAGFFGFFDYTKPGPGVDKDEPPKAAIKVFFDVLGRKFWNLVKLNLLFTIFNIPALIAVLIASMFFFPRQLSSDVFTDLFFRFLFGAIIICIPLITVGPAQAGFTYILRNYSREEHAFIWWDFKDNAKKNFKESIIISLIDFAVTIIMGITLNFYFSYQGGNILMTFATGLLVMAFVLYLMMHLYIYPMLVTFKLSIKQIYKNALLFAIMKFIPNLGILLLCIILVVATFYNTIIGIILFPLITVSLIGYITNFYVYPKLKKYMMAEEDDDEYEDDDEEEESSDEPVFSDQAKNINQFQGYIPQYNDVEDEDEDEEEEEDEEVK